jgi:hypothetical protein
MYYAEFLEIHIGKVWILRISYPLDGIQNRARPAVKLLRWEGVPRVIAPCAQSQSRNFLFYLKAFSIYSTLPRPPLN